MRWREAIAPTLRFVPVALAIATAWELLKKAAGR